MPSRGSRNVGVEADVVVVVGEAVLDSSVVVVVGVGSLVVRWAMR